MEEVTGVFDAAPDIAAVTQHINSRTVAVRLDGHSDYGMVLEAFWDQWARRSGRGPALSCSVARATTITPRGSGF
jgi:uncharacterized protein with von Willebrand factor type A (vWA) domain